MARRPHLGESSKLHSWNVSPWCALTTAFSSPPLSSLHLKSWSRPRRTYMVQQQTARVFLPKSERRWKRRIMCSGSLGPIACVFLDKTNKQQKESWDFWCDMERQDSESPELESQPVPLTRLTANGRTGSSVLSAPSCPSWWHCHPWWFNFVLINEDLLPRIGSSSSHRYD